MHEEAAQRKNNVNIKRVDSDYGFDIVFTDVTVLEIYGVVY